MVDSAKREGAGRRSERAGTGSPAVEETASDLSRAAPQPQGDSVRSVAALVGANSIGAVLGAAGGLLVARFLGPETVGNFRAYTIPLMFLVPLQLGTFEGLQRQIPYLLGRGKRDAVDDIVSAARAWSVTLSTVFTAGFFVIGAWRLVRGDVHGALAWGSQMVVAWGVFYGGFLGATYRTTNHFVTAAKVQTLQVVSAFLLVFELPWMGFAGLCLRAAGPSGLATWLLHRWRPLRAPPRLRGRPLLELIKLGLPFCLWNSLYAPIWSAAENALILALGGVKVLGLFAVAFLLREGVCILPQALNQVMAPRVAREYGKEGRLGDEQALVYRLALLSTIGMTALVVMFSFLLDVLAPTLLPRYVEGVPLMKVMLWFGVAQAAATPLTALFAMDEAWRFGRGILAGGLVFLAATYLLFGSVGALAVPLGSLAGKIVRIVVGYGELRHLRKHGAHRPKHR